MRRQGSFGDGSSAATPRVEEYLPSTHRKHQPVSRIVAEQPGGEIIDYRKGIGLVVTVQMISDRLAN